MSETTIVRQPFGYHLSLCPAVPEPPFDDPGELEGVWGRRWGASDEVGRLRVVLVREPRGEWGRGAGAIQGNV